MKNQFQHTVDFRTLGRGHKKLRRSIFDQLSNTEKIIWVGKPKLVFGFTPLEHGNMSLQDGPANFQFGILAIALSFGFIEYQRDHHTFAMILIALGFFVFLLPDLLKRIRRVRTKYILTNQRVFFKLWRYGNHSIHHIPLNELNDVRYKEHKDKSGILFFIPKRNPGFQTIDFYGSVHRPYPTFEDVEYVEDVFKLIRDTIYKKQETRLAH